LSRKKTGWAGSARRIGDAYMIATVLPIAVLLGYGAGWALDRMFGTSPWFTYVFGAIGIAAGLREAVRIALRVGREEDEAAARKGTGDRGQGTEEPPERSPGDEG
jgi:F0F1-type ATP synthase assembly protein I